MDNELLVGLFKALQGGAQGYQGAEQTNLMNALRQQQMGQQQANADRSFGLQQDRFNANQDWRTSQIDNQNRNRMIDQNMWIHEMAAKDPSMQGRQDPKTFEQLGVLAALYPDQYGQATESPPYLNWQESKKKTPKTPADSNIALNRRKGMVDDEIGRQQDRELTEYVPHQVDQDVTTLLDAIRQSQIPTNTEDAPGLGTGNIQVANPAYGPAKEVAFWNPGSPQAQDSSSTLLFGNQNVPDPDLALFQQLTPQQLATFDWAAYERDNPGKSAKMKAMLSQ